MKNNKKLIKYLVIIAILVGVVFLFFFIKNNYREGLTTRKPTTTKPTATLRPPSGTYQKDCTDIIFDGKFLSASCKGQKSTLEIKSFEPCDDIIISAGKLVCVKNKTETPKKTEKPEETEKQEKL